MILETGVDRFVASVIAEKFKYFLSSPNHIERVSPLRTLGHVQRRFPG